MITYSAAPSASASRGLSTKKFNVVWRWNNGPPLAASLLQWRAAASGRTLCQITRRRRGRFLAGQAQRHVATRINRVSSALPAGDGISLVAGRGKRAPENKKHKADHHGLSS